ncbi:MAG: hypothetical protein N2Z23_10050 [Pyrinomonadaceae bacterium]|nr:hypothetical protein [Pyrinomonadaceae bacterium]MCX7640766.1 hypothetical protein [Pyrinomonadaceae bacterium]MDW8304661.1 hypothetical protein [Acidobacteriota bacterium]
MMKKAEDYAKAIMRDETEKFASEKTITHTDNYIERLYEFHDGAVVKYEWQGLPLNAEKPEEIYNHRFTLIKLPSPNPNNLKLGVIKVINYPKRNA